MKILVLSDSHGRAALVERAILLEQPDVLLHLGDGAGDLPPDLPIPSTVVRGNCDLLSTLPKTLELNLEGVRLFMTHGHPYGVKLGLLRVTLAAREARAGLLLFGHTHIPMYELREGLHILNPGSAADRRYAVVELNDGNVFCRLKQLS